MVEYSIKVTEAVEEIIIATTAESTLVIGHRNPDMDAIASAIGYAWLLEHTSSEKYIAGRAGQVNAQTTFALEYFKVDAPILETDVRTRVSDLVEKMPSLQRGQTLLEACQSIARTRRPAPLLDEDQKPIGLISGAGLFATMADALSSTSVLALAKEFDRPAESAVDSSNIVLQGEEFIRDVISQVLRSDYDEFLVVDDDGHYSGLCRKSHLLSPPRRKIVMVDHNELAQAVPGLEEGEVVEVLDHHRLSSMPTSVPIRFSIEPVGSCSTLVAERGVEQGIVFPEGIAGLLLSGILSDTLIFRSPTATPRDRSIALKLAVMAKLALAKDKEEKVFQSIADFGQQLLASGAGLGMRPVEEIIGTDIKYYETNGAKVGIAQVEVANLSELTPRLEALHEALEELTKSQKLTLALLMVTDVVLGNSRLVVVGQPRVVATLPYPRLDDETLDAPGIMSRKKQLLPTVLAALSQSM
ncbi:MAG: DHH family phosphoesterase [Anaerolineae bacterium]|nr:DHH family phosphoesterase [Anaerolineae bacterium]